ncbi:MAG: NUDIX domain-containing protein [Planctomycetaceae bacterium]|nr:NUDIX domain-containing protein [Planctomycetaceae bacterium]
MSTTRRTRVAAYGLLTDGDQILLCRLAKRLPGHREARWTLPGGGIDFGEPPEAAMIREVQEETGLLVEATLLAGIDSIVADAGGVPCHNIRIMYRARIVSGSLRNEIHGSTDLCQWWHKDQCPELVDVAQAGLRLAFS